MAAASIAIMALLGVSGAIAALGDTLFPARSLAERLLEDLDPAANIFLRLRLIHPLLAASAIWLPFYAMWTARRRPKIRSYSWAMAAWRRRANDRRTDEPCPARSRADANAPPPAGRPAMHLAGAAGGLHPCRSRQIVGHCRLWSVNPKPPGTGNRVLIGSPGSTGAFGLPVDRLPIAIGAQSLLPDRAQILVQSVEALANCLRAGRSAVAGTDGSLRLPLAILGRIDLLVIDDWAMALLREPQPQE
jgi:hypothetical protein